jgi:hypothetical protein
VCWFRARAEALWSGGGGSTLDPVVVGDFPPSSRPTGLNRDAGRWRVGTFGFIMTPLAVDQNHPHPGHAVKTLQK